MWEVLHEVFVRKHDIFTSVLGCLCNLEALIEERLFINGRK